MDEAELVIEETKDKMQKSVEAFKNTMAQIRSGRAAPALVEDIKAEVYGQMMPINQLGTISIPEARQILVDVWDKGNVQTVEKAIQASGRNLNPNVDGGLIRINLPELTEENRKEMVKLAKQKLEDYKVTARNIRRDTNESLKKLKDQISEDDFHNYQNQVQKITDENTKKMDDIQQAKEKEIMTI